MERFELHVMMLRVCRFFKPGERFALTFVGAMRLWRLSATVAPKAWFWTIICTLQQYHLENERFDFDT